MRGGARLRPVTAATKGVLAVSMVTAVVVWAPGALSGAATTAEPVAPWSTSSVPLPSGVPATSSTSLDMVTCSSATFCAAVGQASAAAALVETGVPGAWTPATVSEPTYGNGSGLPDARLFSVTCPADGSCEAVGSYLVARGKPTPFAVKYANGAWSQQALTVPAGLSWAELDGISCVTTSSCFAVGFGFTSGAQPVDVPLIATLANGSWSGAVAPAPPGGKALGDLSSVSCLPIDWCAAVGDGGVAVGDAPLVETLSNGKWTASLVGPPGTSLGEVSCAGNQACAAIGTAVGGGGILASKTTPAGWVMVPTPSPTGLPSAGGVLWNIPDSVSCGAPGQCSVVGTSVGSPAPNSALVGSVAYNLVYHVWEPSFIKAQQGSTTTPPGAGLSAVSCGGPGECTAVGDYRTRNGYVGVVETFRNNVWREATLPSPSPSLGSGFGDQFGLWSLSCPTPTRCAAVGEYGLYQGSVPVIAETGF